MDQDQNDDYQYSADDSLILNDQEHTHLDELWDQLNLTPEQKQAERNKLQNRLKQETEIILKEEFNMKDEMLSQIDELKEKEIQFMKALKKPHKEIEQVSKLGVAGSLIRRLNEVKASYDEVLPLYIVRVKLFNDLWNRINALFDKIGYDDSSREGFAYFDNNDLSTEKEDLYNQKLKNLEDEYNERVKSIEDLSERIHKMSNEIEEEISPAIDQLLKSKQVNTVSYTTILDYYEDFTSLRDDRAKQVSSIALEITHCWDLLKVPEEERKEFIVSHSKLSLSNINELENKLNELHSQIESNLTEMTEEIRKEIINICQFLHYTQEQIDEQLVEQEDEKTTFYNYEKKLIELKKLSASSQSLVQMIQQREDIINQYKSIDESKHDPSNEKIKIRYKSVPRLERKLLIELIKFKEIYSHPFTWDGENYEDKLNHVKLSISEIKQAKTQAHKVTKRMKKVM